ncbi:beta strand repeat-containing protein [Polynucleobacter necessarius]|uniref:beta strand repeat-containing protein n=1 Tax=Polynucleobacter necessarius TaxID=576610 RepID=UPI001E2BA5BB|nr:GLEYA domain-containing protein [Polynucleobacter necessarius]
MTLGDLTLATGIDLVLGDAGSRNISVASITGPGSGTSNVTFSNSGTVNVSGDFKTGIGTLWLNKTVGAVTFAGSTQMSQLRTDGSAAYNLSLTGASNSIASFYTATPFETTGTLILGDESTDVFTYSGGPFNPSRPASLSLAGSIITSNTTAGNGAVTLGDANTAVTLGSDFTIDTSASNSNITVASSATIAGAGKAMTLNAGTGTIAITSALSGMGDLAFIANEINWSAAIAGTGTLSLKPTTAANVINVGGASDAGASTLDILAAEIAFLGNTFSGVTIGGGIQSGNINISGNTTFTAPVTFTTSGKTVLSANLFASGSADITVTNDMQVSGANRTITTASGNLTLAAVDAIGTAYGLTLTTTSGVMNIGNVGASAALASLTSSAGGTTNFIGSTVTTTGTQTYNNAVTLSANTTFATTNSAIVFDGTVDSATGLTKNLSANVGTSNITFTGAVGGSQGLGNISLTSTGITTISSTISASAFTQNSSIGTTAINGGSITTSGAQAFGNAVTLGDATTLSTTNNNITFSSTLNSSTTARNLTLNAGTGAVSFGGIVGGGLALGNLSSTAATTANTAAISGIGAYSITGAATFTGAVTGVNSITASGLATITNNITTTGAQTYNGNVVLAANTTLATTDSDVSFGGTLNGAYGLTVNNGSGTVTFSAAVGGSTPLTSLNIAGSGEVVINANITVSASAGTGGLIGEIFIGYFADNLTFFATASTYTAYQSRFNNTFKVVNCTTPGCDFADYYSVSYKGYFLATTTGSYTFYTNSDDASYLWLGTAGQSFSSLISTRTVANALVNNGSVHAFSERSGTISLVAGNYYPLLSYFGENGGGDGIIISFTPPGGSKTTDGTNNYFSNSSAASAVTFAGNVKVGANATISSGSGDMTFGAAVYSAANGGNTASAANNLTVSAGAGNVTFTGVVGGATNGALGALAVNTTGTTIFGAAVTAASLTTNTGGTVAINGGAITTSGAQTYNDAVTLGADTTLNTTNSNIVFVNTLNSTTSARALTIGAGSGTVTFTGTVGNSLALGATNITAATTTNMTTLVGSGVYATTGNAVVNGTITGVTNLSVSGITAIGANITTSATQLYSGAVTLATNTTLATTDNNVTFSSTLNSNNATPKTLTITAGGGTVTMNGAVGDANVLGVTTITASAFTTGSSGTIAMGANALQLILTLSVWGRHLVAHQPWQLHLGQQVL